jgi:malonyl-CoA O-methyltransferase
MLRWPFKRNKLASQVAYAVWAETYPANAHNPLMALEQQTTLSLLPEVAGLTVVDAGCGSGRYLRQLRERGADPVGIDLSPKMLARAATISRKVIRANICAMPVASMSVDLVVSSLALGDVPDLAPALGELARVLRRGGRIVYSVVHPVGAAAGWSRTFAANGRQFAIHTYWHTPEDHRHACEAAGLRITAWQEPVLAEAPHHPALLVVRASR